MDGHNPAGINDRAGPALPRHARLPVNRCNLPAAILGSLTFQRSPVALRLDAVEALHRDLFRRLRRLPTAGERRALFLTHMAVSFQLDHPEESGWDAASRHPGRPKADYRRLLRGWMFDSNGREAAVLKGWVESRFGLLPRCHRAPLRDYGGEAYRRYCQERASGLANTNALEAQLDLLYSYCQLELAGTVGAQAQVRLYRGVQRLEAHEILAAPAPRRRVVLLNSLSSFSATPERAEEFGDAVLAARVPVAKVLYSPRLLPGLLQGEDEYLVIGGLYEVELVRP
jgi:NAD+--dinitrogen-reductase ADP-D-ribosyltransferase